jgi:hypothetical protein
MQQQESSIAALVGHVATGKRWTGGNIDDTPCVQKNALVLAIKGKQSTRFDSVLNCWYARRQQAAPLVVVVTSTYRFVWFSPPVILIDCLLLFLLLLVSSKLATLITSTTRQTSDAATCTKSPALMRYVGHVATGKRWTGGNIDDTPCVHKNALVLAIKGKQSTRGDSVLICCCGRTMTTSGTTDNIRHQYVPL